MRTRKVFLALATLVMVLSLAGTAVAQCNPDYVSVAGRSIMVSPTGGDDTPNLRCALDLGVEMGPGVKVKLEAGTFYTEQLAIVGFVGSFEGAGREATVVRTPEYALPIPNPCLGGGPGVGGPCFLDALPSTDNPYPSFVTVAASDVTIADLSIRVVGDYGTETFELFAVSPAINLQFIISVVQPVGPKVSLEIKRAEIDTGPPLIFSPATGTWAGGANAAVGAAYVGQPPERALTDSTLVVAESILRTSGTVATVLNDVSHSRLFFRQNLIVGGMAFTDVFDVDFMLQGNDFQGNGVSTFGVQFTNLWDQTVDSSLWFGNNVFSSVAVGIRVMPGVFQNVTCLAVNNDASGAATPYVWNDNACKVVADK